jgi:hypothetical protein
LANKNVERLKRKRLRDTCELVRLRLTESVITKLESLPHPKLPDSELTAYSYVTWLLTNLHPYKARDIIYPVHSELGEVIDEHKERCLSRDIENIGVPRTYR